MSDHMPTVALDYLHSGQGAALATVISTWGSAPRRVGSQLAVAQDGRFEGSVSGGCVEGAVILEAQDAIADGKCRILEFGVSEDDAFAVGLACGGDIRILVEPIGPAQGIPVETIKALVEANKDRTLAGYTVNLQSFTRQSLGSSAATRLAGELFTQTYAPPKRLCIIGAVHVAQYLAPMAQLLGYDVTIIDPRDSFAASSRFEGVQLITEHPEDTLSSDQIDSRTAMVTLTHDPKIDTPALSLALQSEAFYIGALGSRKTHAKRLAELTNLGFSDAAQSRIFGPVGLDIGAQEPAEIAAAIIAQMTLTLHGPKWPKA